MTKETTNTEKRAATHCQLCGEKMIYNNKKGQFEARKFSACKHCGRNFCQGCGDAKSKICSECFIEKHEAEMKGEKPKRKRTRKPKVSEPTPKDDHFMDSEPLSVTAGKGSVSPLPEGGQVVLEATNDPAPTTEAPEVAEHFIDAAAVPYAVDVFVPPVSELQATSAMEMGRAIHNAIDEANDTGDSDEVLAIRILRERVQQVQAEAKTGADALRILAPSLTALVDIIIEPV